MSPDFEVIKEKDELAIIHLYRESKKRALTQDKENPPAVQVDALRIGVNAIGKGVIRLTICDTSSYPVEVIPTESC